MAAHRTRALRFASLLAFLLSNCAGRFDSNGVPRGKPEGAVYVVSRGWHTDIGLRADDLNTPVRESLGGRFPGARYFVFGFGERAYYTNSRPGLGDMMLALVPSRGAVLVTALNTDPARAFGGGNVVELHLTRSGLGGISSFLSESLNSAATDLPIRLADGPYPGSEFYATPVTYSGVYTCNTWAAEALRRAAMPIYPATIVFAGQLVGAARRMAEAQGIAETATVNAAVP